MGRRVRWEWRGGNGEEGKVGVGRRVRWDGEEGKVGWGGG